MHSKQLYEHVNQRDAGLYFAAGGPVAADRHNDASSSGHGGLVTQVKRLVALVAKLLAELGGQKPIKARRAKRLAARHGHRNGHGRLAVATLAKVDADRGARRCGWRSANLGNHRCRHFLFI